MTFISPLFFLFLIIVVSLNYTLPSRFRNLMILIASFVFIGFYNVESISVLLFFSLFNYYLSKYIRTKQLLFVFGIAVNAIPIVMFNYYNTSSGSLQFTFSLINFQIDKFLLAIGISFYSLQNIAYLTEVFYSRIPYERNLTKYILYNGFFPKIISGPVLLPKEFFPQTEKIVVTKHKLISGFQLMLFGLFRKMVIADRLSSGVSSVFDFHSNYCGLTILFASFLFTIQLYFDFSGYTNMALGIARMLGFDLKDNFNLPFRATSVTEFWRRWHISLISWFTNYIYYPLVFRLRHYKKIAPIVGIVSTFFVSMLWHGIGFTFTAWAFCHVIYLTFETITRKFRTKLSNKYNNRLYKSLCAFIVFVAVCFSNIFFRSSSFEISIQLVHNILYNFLPLSFATDFINPLAVGGHQMDEFNFCISIIFVLSFLLFERKLNRIANSETFNFKFLISILLLILMFGLFNSGSRFIYMQF